MTASGILVAGTSSDAGKSVVTAGLCRALARRGLRVAPFKAQNMSNNSMVCADGGEIGRAQYVQAQAAGVLASTAMNPVLLKPGSDRRSFIVVRGRAAGVLEAGQYAAGRARLAEAAFAAYAELAEEYDLVVCEGAGSPAEINLRDGDYVNLGLARRFGLPVVVVGDIDRGGILAALYGTWALLSDEDRALLKAFLINKFRGDVSVLEPGLVEITRRTGVPFLGVVPWLLDVWLDSEDTLAVGQWRAGPTAPDEADGGAPDRLTVAVIRLPRISNATDVDAIATEPGVDVRVTIDPVLVDAADLVVLPGSRSTATDLGWLRERGLADALVRRAAARRPLVGICGGYQMLGRHLEDQVEAQVGVVPGLGLLPTGVEFAHEKVLGRPVGSWRGHRVEGYEIHHGIARRTTAPSLSPDGAEEPPTPFLDGWQVGTVWGTMWHGIFENDGFRRAWLTEVAVAAGSRWRPATDAPGFGARRARMIDTLADALEDHVDLDALLGLTRVGSTARAAATDSSASSLHPRAGSRVVPGAR
ncbi:cobalamin biosynthesis protein CobQ [Intrasporangium chromatireducens Q5-1]|uniref:Cobyric acid synthase n=1 Tax=Intrasporangium chromatireducens Q5-1 TaxID=584657 RepID=W9GG76_9MICO|nr:cobyric acid synthase [Intrasporangium chromatireducens]EWT05040.1 cobalamin biosynthesis protein CobQ [Intrasporangium chromatireducens Q5-1]